MAPRLNVIATTLLAVALFAAAAEGRVVHTILAPINGTATSTLNASSPANVDVGVATEGRKLAGAGAVVNAHICDDLAFKDLCYGLAKLPGVTTPEALLEAAVRASLGKARAAKARFVEAMKSSKQGNPMASILQSCSDNYDDLVSALEEAQRSIVKAHGSNYNVVSKMSAASTYAGDCDNWFDERSIASPYEPMQLQVKRVVSITLGLASKTKNL